MFHISRPTEAQIRATLAQQQVREFSYPEVGCSRGELPRGYTVLHRRTDIGRGSATFERAMEAVSQWKMFDLPGIWLCWPSVPVCPGNAVAIVIKHFGFWSLNCCRIVYVVNDEDGPVRRYGFAYGTLPEHAERGEERFTVEWDRGSDLVSYDILSFSRPGNLPTQVAYPAARWLQRRFVRNSLVAMARAVQPGTLVSA
jgi:uncharacterized protein (UPF0548 family)